MFELSAFVKVMFFVTALCYACLHASGAASTPSDPVIPSPSEYCASFTTSGSTVTSDGEQTCYLRYLSDRSYEQATDPQRVALYTSFPVLFVVLMAYLGMRFVRSS